LKKGFKIKSQVANKNLVVFFNIKESELMIKLKLINV